MTQPVTAAPLNRLDLPAPSAADKDPRMTDPAARPRAFAYDGHAVSDPEPPAFVFTSKRCPRPLRDARARLDAANERLSAAHEHLIAARAALAAHDAAVLAVSIGGPEPTTERPTIEAAIRGAEGDHHGAQQAAQAAALALATVYLAHLHEVRAIAVEVAWQAHEEARKAHEALTSALLTREAALSATGVVPWRHWARDPRTPQTADLGAFLAQTLGGVVRQWPGEIGALGSEA